MERIRIDPDRPDPRRLAPAIDALRRGLVIVYPTDTGYAFGCALSSSKGIARLRKLKGIDKKHKKPLTMLVRELSEMGRYGFMSNTAFRTVRRLLPGPYTMIVHASSDVPRAMKNRNAEGNLVDWALMFEGCGNDLYHEWLVDFEKWKVEH